jgi:hypothetical protein
MLDNRLMSTRVELLSGTALVESDDPETSVKDPAVTIIYKDYEIQPVKFGIFELTTDPSQMKVYKGQANVVAGGMRSAVHEGRLLSFSAALPTEKFDEKQADDLYLWARDRSGALSAANLASARSLNQGGYSLNNLYMGGMYPGLGFNSGLMGGWYLNQNLGMYSYIPYDGIFMSPWGYGIFSPGMIYSYYSPGGYTWYGSSGARNTSFVPQPVSGNLATLRSGTNSGAPTRLTNGLSAPGSNSGSLAMARGGFTSGLARSVGSPEGGRFGGGSAGSSSNSGVTSSSTGASSAARSSGGFSGGSTGGGGGMAGGAGGGAHGGGHGK